MSLCMFSNAGAGSIDVVLTGYTTGFQTLTNFAQLQNEKVYYPYKAIQNDLTLQIQCNNEAFFSRFQDYVAKCMQNALNSDTDQSVGVRYPARSMYVKGYFTQVP